MLTTQFEANWPKCVPGSPRGGAEGPEGAQGAGAEGTKAILEFVAEPCGFCGTSHCFSHSILVAPCGSLLLLVDSTTA